MRAKEQMEWVRSSWQLLVVLAAGVSAVCIAVRRWHGERPTHFPPGPPAWPIIGHLHLLGKLPHQSLYKLSSTYGPLLGLRLGGVRAIVASSPQMAKMIMTTHDLTFANRPSRSAAILRVNPDSMVFAPYGPLWKFLRQLCAVELFSSKRKGTARRVREEEVRGMLRRIGTVGEGGTKAVELRPSLLAGSCDITCKMVMGKTLADVSMKAGSDERGKQEMVRLVEELLHLVAVIYVGDYVPWLWWLDPHGYLKQMKAAGQKARALMQDAMDTRRQELTQLAGGRISSADPPEHLLDALLAAAAHPKPDQPRITDDSIIAVLLDLLLGAAETSSMTIEWALADLTNNTRVMHKLQEEMDSIVGKERLVEESDLEKLPYLACVVKESMRLHPVAPLLVPHESSKECRIGGYRIPAKTRAFVNTWAIGRDPLIWEKPLEFWPERFENKNVHLHGSSFELLPFGYGRRGCPGQEMGTLNVHLTFAALVQAFDWSLVSPSSRGGECHIKSHDMSERYGLSLSMDNPLLLFPSARLPLYAYGS